MPEVAPRYPCPVCLGVPMQKTPLGAAGELVLDHCRRCGGVWFELGEVQQLKGRPPKELWDRVTRRKTPFRSQCHGCHAPLDRDAEKCPACGCENRIDCPVCQQTLHSQTYQGITLDVCRDCKGVWFDHAELAALWSLSLTTALAQQRSGMGVAPGLDGADVLVDALVYSPDLVFFGARATAHVAASSVELLAQAPEAAAGLFSVVGEAAAAVFHAVLEILGSLDL